MRMKKLRPNDAKNPLTFRMTGSINLLYDILKAKNEMIFYEYLMNG